MEEADQTTLTIVTPREDGSELTIGRWILASAKTRNTVLTVRTVAGTPSVCNWEIKLRRVGVESSSSDREHKEQ